MKPVAQQPLAHVAGELRKLEGHAADPATMICHGPPVAAPQVADCQEPGPAVAVSEDPGRQ
eukprot:11745617-Alexandrium_andersonii.AAC.1